ncbi:MAG: precorrin-6A reductase, partial [Eggerthellaceae bacterium]|nr:precorrin-6A reductase [Eggerthellaceae bacterium]
MGERSIDNRGDRPQVLVFGGTTEGREVAEWLSARGTCSVVVSSLTEYGGSLVEGLPNVESFTGRMLPDAMEQLMRARAFACVVDATHPYAAGVSTSIANACEASGTPRLRVIREGEPEGPWAGVSGAAEAAQLVAKRAGNVLLTTGSNDLAIYVAAIDDYQERLYARILPMEKSIANADSLGIPLDHIIAMKGPFSKELNCALIRQFDIKVLVTKASGKSGGFWEKVEA